MGRRKIEIQPILNDRNRSVTFQKRKQGLFKKAYELGVLCSVDIAIIVIEQRPGRDQKLYEYSSNDIRQIVDRRMQRADDVDSRGPSDYASAVNIGDMDDAEEDDAESPDSPVLLKSFGTKRNWEDDTEEQKVRISQTREGSASSKPISNPYPSVQSLEQLLHAGNQSKKPRVNTANFADAQRDISHPGNPYDAYPPWAEQRLSSAVSQRPPDNNHVERLTRPSPGSSQGVHTQHLRYHTPYPHKPSPPHHSTDGSLTPPSFSPADFSATTNDIPSILSHSRTESGSFDNSTIPQQSKHASDQRSLVPDLLAAFLDMVEGNKGPSLPGDHTQAQGPPASGSYAGCNENDSFQWPVDSADTRGYASVPQSDSVVTEAQPNLGADWLQFLSGLSNATINADHNMYPQPHPTRRTMSRGPIKQEDGATVG